MKVNVYGIYIYIYIDEPHIKRNILETWFALTRQRRQEHLKRLLRQFIAFMNGKEGCLHQHIHRNAASMTW